MIRADERHYLVSRRVVHAAVATLLLLTVVVGAAAYVLAEQWLPEIERMLDLEAPMADPDAVVLGSTPRSRPAEQAAAELVRSGTARHVVLLGRPFTPDDLAPAERSRRYDRLVALGVPRDRIVELYQSTELWDQIDDLAAATGQHGWKRVLFMSSPGGTRRVLLGAQSALRRQGAEVGLRTYPHDDDVFEPLWWTDAQLRGHVLYNWILFVFGRLIGRY